ncbi:MAG: hypothetical protein JXA77_02515 [Bacteroidales bacterium]|nr:hypothetical protein [Bacteroidales bacterium]MBN2817813.1 hypothetical protein [Bacteroidales bacterium]
MKKLLIPVVFALILISCGNANKETVNNMATEMCEAMALISDADPMSILEAASSMTKIAENVEEYGKVTEEQLLSAMKEICPEGAEKYFELTVEEE